MLSRIMTSKTVRLLFEAGANLNVTMGNASPLALALRYGHSDIVTLLLRAGAKR